MRAQTGTDLGADTRAGAYVPRRLADLEGEALAQVLFVETEARGRVALGALCVTGEMILVVGQYTHRLGRSNQIGLGLDGLVAGRDRQTVVLVRNDSIRL